MTGARLFIQIHIIVKYSTMFSLFYTVCFVLRAFNEMLCCKFDSSEIQWMLCVTQCRKEQQVSMVISAFLHFRLFGGVYCDFCCCCRCIRRNPLSITCYWNLFFCSLCNRFTMLSLCLHCYHLLICSNWLGKKIDFFFSFQLCFRFFSDYSCFSLYFFTLST